MPHVAVSVPLDHSMIDDRVEVLGYESTTAGFANIEEADTVVAGGRGLRRGDDFALLQGLAGLLHAEVGDPAVMR